MGTSNPFAGGNNSNPLIPSWVGGGDVAESPGAAPDEPQGGNPEAPAAEDEAAPPNRFQSPRTNFFKLAKGGGGAGTGGGASGGDRSMRRAVGGFVGRSSGGAQRASQRMASERTATANLGRILSSAGASTIQDVVRRLGFAQLATLPVPDIYAALIDVICDPGGDLDESFAREAYVKALAEIVAADVDLERPTAETSVSFLASFIANAIENRFLNAVGNKVVSVPLDVAAVQNLEQKINDYIRGEVNDAIAEAGADFPLDRIIETIDVIYERSCQLLQDAQDWADEADEGGPSEGREEEP